MEVPQQGLLRSGHPQLQRARRAAALLRHAREGICRQAGLAQDEGEQGQLAGPDGEVQRRADKVYGCGGDELAHGRLLPAVQ
jgi:hypothetical protein